MTTKTRQRKNNKRRSRKQLSRRRVMRQRGGWTQWYKEGDEKHYGVLITYDPNDKEISRIYMNQKEYLNKYSDLDDRMVYNNNMVIYEDTTKPRYIIYKQFN